MYGELDLIMVQNGPFPFLLPIMGFLRMETAKKWNRADEEIAGVCITFLAHHIEFFTKIVSGYSMRSAPERAGRRPVRPTVIGSIFFLGLSKRPRFLLIRLSLTKK